LKNYYKKLILHLNITKPGTPYLKKDF